MHNFRDNAVTGDIPLISLVLISMVPPKYLVYLYVRNFWDILRQAALTVCVLARLCLASIGTGGENSVASGLNTYSLQTILIQYDYIYTKI